MPRCTARPGVDDITAVVIILLEGNPKDKSWSAATKLMNNVDKFLERLRTFKAVIDEGKVRRGGPAGRARCLEQGGLLLAAGVETRRPPASIMRSRGLGRAQDRQDRAMDLPTVLRCAALTLPRSPLQVQKKTVEACRSYLELPHFNRDIIYTKSHAAAGLCEWAVNIVKYYDVVSEVHGQAGVGVGWWRWGGRVGSLWGGLSGPGREGGGSG